MKLRLLLLGLILGICMPSFAQIDVDVTKLTADTKTFIFSNNKNTVKGYIYSQLESQTGCCGSDRIYLEVKIDPSGYVLQVKTLTGKNDCFKKSAIDIVKNVKWDAANFKGPKSVYFEIKPNIDCSGDRPNNYAQIEIFNNEKLDKSGNRIYSPSAGPVKPATTPPATASTPPKTTPQPTAKTTPEKTTPAEDKTIAANQTPQKPVTKTPTPPPAATKQPPPRTTPSIDPATTPMSTTARPIREQPSEEELEAEREAIRIAEADRVRKEAEINKLKEQMVAMRAQAEAQRERQLEQERRRKEQAEEQRRREEEQTFASDDAGNAGEGGLFLDDLPPEGETSSGERGDFTSDSGDPDQRLREDIARLEQQKREIEQAKVDRETETRRQLEENDRANQELVQLEEQILQKQEEAQQQQEQRELDQLEQDRQRVEDERQKQEEEYQRMMDEIKRLQDEAQTKISDLERQKADLDNLIARKQAREQEIVLDREIRRKETERRMEEMRLSMLSSSRSIPPAGSAVTGDPSLSTSIIPDMSVNTPADSQKLIALIQIINQMREEMVRLQSEIQRLGGYGSQPGIPAGTGAPIAAPRTPAKLDKSFDNLDYTAPGMKKEDYITTTAKTVTPTDVPKAVGYKKGDGYRPDPSHKDTHANVPGPKLPDRSYIDGDNAMKQEIQTQLKTGGVCGLAHVVFSVTLDPAGNVISHQILAANDPMVQVLMDNNIIPTLKFNSVDGRIKKQTVYQEIKGEIVCDGTEKKVDLKNVKNLLKNE